MIWLYFVYAQLLQLVAMVIGWLLLIPFCLWEAWDARDNWKWGPLNKIYGNPEDGVSGLRAVIWNTGGTAKVPYKPRAWAPWRAYCWSALRNSADQLKYVFSRPDGPLVRWGKLKFGWQKENGFKVPVLSWG